MTFESFQLPSNGMLFPSNHRLSLMCTARDFVLLLPKTALRLCED